ncbi:hypothetical protein [Methanosarcina sp.]|uniref:hypothetical protein n=1 Tax=Methanosarcina sp. TaxID=2213 RepID=UPI003BB5CDF4
MTGKKVGLVIGNNFPIFPIFIPSFNLFSIFCGEKSRTEAAGWDRLKIEFPAARL